MYKLNYVIYIMKEGKKEKAKKKNNTTPHHLTEQS